MPSAGNPDLWAPLGDLATLAHTQTHARARTAKPVTSSKEGPRVLHSVGSATRAQRMPAAAEDASPARAHGGDRNFPERTVLFAHCKGANRIRLPAKTWSRESDPKKQLPGAGAAPPDPEPCCAHVQGPTPPRAAAQG